MYAKVANIFEMKKFLRRKEHFTFKILRISFSD